MGRKVIDRSHEYKRLRGRKKEVILATVQVRAPFSATPRSVVKAPARPAGA